MKTLREKTSRLSCKMKVGFTRSLDDQLISINRCGVWEQLQSSCNAVETEWRKGSCSRHQR